MECANNLPNRRIFGRHLAKIISLQQDVCDDDTAQSVWNEADDDDTTQSVWNEADDDDTTQSVWNEAEITFSQFKKKCESEVSQMQRHIIPGTDLSVYDVLTMNEYRVACLLRNPLVEFDQQELEEFEDKSNERIQSLILLSKNVDDHRSGILLSKATIRAETSPASLSQVIRVAAFLPTVYCRKQLGIVKLFRNNGIFIVSNDDKLRLQKGNDSWDLIEIHLDQNSLAQKETLTVISMNNKSDGGRGKHDLEWIFHNTSLKIQTERSLQKAATTQPAVDSTNFEVFKHILSHKFIIQYSLVLPQEIGSLLTVASNRGQEILVQLALDYGANVDFISSKGRTALHWATRNGALPPVKILLKNGADVNKKDGKGWTPLHFAANQGHLEIVRTLLLNGAEINPTGSDDRTPLHWAAGNGLVAVVNLLLDEGANVNAEDEDGYTPLHFATKQEHLDVMELLVLNGADVNSKAKDRGYTPLHLLAYHWICPQNAVVQLLIERGAAVDTKDNNGNTPLQVAVANTNVLWTSVVQLLIDGGADVSSKDRLFRTPLQNAGSFEMMKVLLENGADPNESDSSQLRALLEEIDYEGPSRIQVWLDHGACVERKFDGKSVLAWAYLCGRSSTKAFEYVLERCFINPFSLIGTEIHETLFHPTFDLHHYAGMDGANHRSVVCSQPYIRHLVKIMSLNLYEFIDIDIESIWHWRGETFSDFKEKCEAEVNKMKGQLIAGAYLSVFDVLAKSENEISCLLRNQSVELDLSNYMRLLFIHRIMSDVTVDELISQHKNIFKTCLHFWTAVSFQGLLLH
ncbi:unnamed protein product [Bemisia tabaci]|uniref:Uncharacterized protein n=1 Tax=Bemisia tabaci TaxID=7038 RepID=A0A9P0F7I8_BEMTA|nr:unnamed protein product [Bemisia tabaci]